MMKEYRTILQKTNLFSGFAEQQIEDCLRGMGATVEQYEKDTVVALEGDPATRIGIVLEGRVNLSKTDFEGNRNLIAKLTAGELFQEAAAFSDAGILPFDVVTETPCKLLFFRAGAVFDMLAETDGSQLVQNLLKIVASKNIQLTRKIDLLTKRSIREKVLGLLFSEAKRTGKTEFTLKMDRNQMAAYLSVDRSALSRELAKMQGDGLLDYQKNRFKLHMRSDDPLEMN